MEIILKCDDKKLGKRNTVITVKDGYGAYLIREGKAVIANQRNVNKLAEELKLESEMDEANKNLAMQAKNSIEHSIYYIYKSYNEKTRQINGSVTKKDVIDAISDSKFPFLFQQSSFIIFPRVKYVDEIYTAKLKLYKDIIAEIKFSIKKVD